MTAPRYVGIALLAGVLAFGGWAPQAAAAAPESPSAPAPATTPGAGSGTRLPGPALLHAGLAKAPQLENTGIWRAAPLGVCMASAYRAGEYVHQGCVYDDNGGGIQYRWFYDTLMRNYTYPENPAYRRNAADILEVRVKPLKDATAFRVTMNTMTDPNLLGLTLALGDSTTAYPAPHNANTVMPAQRFVTVHGTQGDVTDAASGRKVGTPGVRVDQTRRQIEIRVPHAVFDPTGQDAVRVALAAGLWDTHGDGYLVPQATADATHPGGAIQGDDTPSAFFDTAFRFTEPFEAPYRDALQKRAIADGDISAFHADIDFVKLAKKVRDDSGIPTHGYVTRVYASHSEKAQGRRLPTDPGGPPAWSGTQQGGIQTGTGEGSVGRPSMQFGWPCRDDCVPDLPGRMQRYNVYIPSAKAPRAGYPSLVWTNGYALRPGDDVADKNDLYQVFANRPGNPTMVIDVDARGNDQWFYGASGANVFEAIADARRNYPLDTERTTMGGFSSGAYGANKLALQFPDVFNKAFICDGLDMAPSFPGLNGIADKLPADTVTAHEPGSKLTPLLPSRRNQPVMEWGGTTDDFIPYNITRERADAYAAGAYDYEFISWTGLAAEHLSMCKGGMWGLAARWLGNSARAVNPAHVTYVRDPLMDDPQSGLVGDKAYWVSGIVTREQNLGTIDVVSAGRGLTDAPAQAKRTSFGTEQGTLSPVNPYLREFRHVGAPIAGGKADKLTISAKNIAAIVIDPKRAGVTCGATFDVVSDGPISVRMLGCGQARSFPGSGAGSVSHLAAPPAQQASPLGTNRDQGPFVGAPFPNEFGNLPQPPLQSLPPYRFPPNFEVPVPFGNHETPPLSREP
jgi:predicted esterase